MAWGLALALITSACSDDPAAPKKVDSGAVDGASNGGRDGATTDTSPTPATDAADAPGPGSGGSNGATTDTSDAIAADAADAQTADAGTADATEADATAADAATDAIPADATTADLAVEAAPPVVFDCEDTAKIPAARSRAIDSTGSSLFFISGEGYGAFNVFDVSAPAAPVMAASLTLTKTTGCWYPGGVALAPGGNHAYIYGLGCAGLPVIDVTNRASPVPVSIVAGASGGSMDLKICGNMAYVALQAKGVAAYDISNPAAPVFRAQSDIDGMPYPYGVTCATGDATTDYVFLGDGGTNKAPAGLRIYEFNKTTNVFTARGAHTPTVNSWGGRGWPISSTLMYMGWSDTGQLALFDISNKDTLPAPTLFPGAGDTNTQLLVTGKYLFTTSTSKGYGLGVYDISTPASPNLVYHKRFDASVIGLSRFTTAGKDYLAYTVNGGSAISVCRLSNL